MTSFLLPPEIRALADFSTCDIADAIEESGMRLRNQGFTDSSVQCRFPSRPPLIGYAVTIQIRAASPPIAGGHMVEQTAWWKAFEDVPSPRILVIEDVDRHPGIGALVGKMHAGIFRALGTTGIVTNGAVRHLPYLEEIGMGVFSGSVSASHAYAHIVSVGMTVHVGGLAVSPGDLLHGDLHGVVQIPEEAVAGIPAAVERRRERERRLANLCAKGEVSPDDLKALVANERYFPSFRLNSN